jgi:hypothetical protein
MEGLRGALEVVDGYRSLALLFGSVLELMANWPPTSTMSSGSRMLFWVTVTVIWVGLVVCVVGLVVYYNTRVAADEVICGEDQVISVGAPSPYCYPPAPGEGMLSAIR